MYAVHYTAIDVCINLNKIHVNASESCYPFCTKTSIITKATTIIE